MKTTVVLFIVFVLFAPVKLFFKTSVSEATQDLPKVVITYGALAEREAPLHVATYQGLFRKHGIDALAVHVRGAPVGIAAIGAGESQFWYGTASGVTLGAITSGLDGVFLAGLINKVTGTFVVRPAIKSPSDLKDRTIGVTSMGGGIWMYTMLALEHWKIDTKRDRVNLRVVGDQPVIAQAIATGVVDGGYLSYTFASALERQGFRVLIDFSTLDIPFPSVGLYGRRSFVNQSPETVGKTLRALTEAITFIQNPTNKAAVMNSLAKGLHLPRVEDAQDGYDKVKHMFDLPIYSNIDGMRNAIRLLGFTNDKIGRLKAEDVIDNRILKKLEQEGFFAK
jgi:ABC-type nitrate/sulfonate/bicarbonate transport system substrate-binding protein